MKELFDNYLKELFSKSNQEQVISVGLMIFKIVLFLFAIVLLSKPEILEQNGIWTLITAIFSAPILFLIWRFRDQNATQQIENQRKDINLKEFQKIAEWVSGLHLIEDEITEKTTKDNKQELETTTKYTQPNNAQSIPTFSKREGAVGLQIAAIHSLLPFFQGKHGDYFRRPALNLLTSSWSSLQQKDLSILETILETKDVFKNSDKFNTQIKRIQRNAKSPIGVALTQVLLSDGGDNLLKFPEVFPNLCLAGMDFHLPGLDKKVLSLFFKAKNCQGINLIGANLSNANLSKTQLEYASLINTNLENAVLKNAIINHANLYNARLEKANFANAELNGSTLEDAILNKANLTNSSLAYANLTRANLAKANLTEATVMRAILRDARLSYVKLNNANLLKTDLTNAMLYSAELIGAYLRLAKLQECNLDNANLKGVNLTNVRSINGATFLDAITTGTCLEEAQLTDIRNLDKNKIFILFSSKSDSPAINIGSFYLSIKNKKNSEKLSPQLR